MKERPEHGSGPPQPAARTIDSHFARPVVRVAVLVAALTALGLIGHAASAGALDKEQAPSSAPSPAPATPAFPAHAAAPPEAPTRGGPPEPTAAPSARTPASADNPVFLNTADADELRRLPGIGEKRANAVVALRSKLGRFRAVEDLLKVKGIGRATLRRLRPLVRVDPPSPDGGGAPGVSPTPPR